MDREARMRGYYSLIQYCPDRGRLEAVNVGALLLCPERGFLGVRLADSNDRAERLFGAEGFNDSALEAAKIAMRNRIESMRGELASKDALTRFVNSRANDLLLTAPRPTATADPDSDLDRLFAELVADRPEREAPR